MITRISVKNFKSIKNIDVSVSNLNLLMGLNGMGKSSFIQVLLLLMQSDKLEEKIINLNGILTHVGQGRDALYQFAIERDITFQLTFDGQQTFSWKFPYQSDKEQLTSEIGYAGDKMIFFRENTERLQYVSAERFGPRDIYEASNIAVVDNRQLGISGEFAVYYINVFGLEYIVPEILRKDNAFSNKLIHQLNAWMQDISPGVSINTKYVPEVNKVILDYQFEITTQKTNSFRPKNVGFGISYVLPVVLSLLTSEKGKIIVIENPESHIHPRGQAELGKLIALAANAGAQLFIETHSDHILNGIRVAVKEKCIETSKVNVMYFDKVTTDAEQFSQVAQIKIDRNGELSEYPKDFLDEWSNQLLKLI
jgi:predicted ATPase